MAMRRYLTNEDQFGRLNVADLATGTSHRIFFNYTGSANSTTARTWDFAPVDEQMECDPEGHRRFRWRMHNDDEFIANQIKWNNREQIWNTRTTSTTTGGLSIGTGTAADTNGTFWMTSDVFRYRGKIPWVARHAPRLWSLYEKTEIARKPLEKFTKWLLPNKTAEEHQKQLAEKNSVKLLKGWLDEHEFNELMKRGELEIFAEDVVYIVKKDPNERVTKVTKDGKQKKFCIITEELGYAIGDILLTKIMLLKTDPQHFEELSNAYDV